MAYALTAFGDLALPDRNVTTDLGGGDARSDYLEIEGGGVVRLQGSDRAPNGDTVIPLRATLRADTPAALDTALRALKARKGAVGQLWRTWYDGRVEWTTAELTRLRESKTFGPKTVIPLELGFTQISPAWYAEAPIDLVAEDLFDEDESDLPTVGAENDPVGTPLEWLVTNTGNLPATRIVFTITSGTGTISAVTLTNATTGHVLAWSGSLTAGQVLSIDAGNERVTKNGVATWAGLTEPADKESWFELAPGDNPVTIALTDSATDDSTTVALYAEHTSA